MHHFLNPTILLPAGLFLTLVFLVRRVELALRRRRMARQRGCLPPPAMPNRGPWNIIQIYHVFKQSKASRIIEYADSLFEKYGNTFRMDALGETNMFTCEPENVKFILGGQGFPDFDLGEVRLKNFHTLLGTGIFASDGEAWAHSRALLKPQFTKTQITDLADLESHLQNLLSKIPPPTSTKSLAAFDIQDLFHKLTLDQATGFLFGQSVNSLLSPPNAPGELDFATAFNTAQFEIGVRFAFGTWGAWYNPKQLQLAVKYVHNYVDRFVQRAIDMESSGKKEKGGKGGMKYVFLEALAEETKDPQVLRDQLLNILLAGRDTTAALLSWAIYLLSRHPEIWRKLQNAIAAEIGEDSNVLPTYENLKAISYLRSVLNETLRLYPVVPLNSRVANKDSVLPIGGGPDGKAPVFVAKGTVVQYSVYTMQRMEEVWGKDKDEFRPERWEEKKRGVEHPVPRAEGWEWLPFNGGPRICIGQQLAITTAGYVLTRLCQLFDRFEPVDPEKELLMNTALVMNVKNGVQVRAVWKDGAREFM